MKVLFIGNSHTFFNDMPYTFSLLAKEGQNVEVDSVMLAHPGRTFEWHLKEFFEIRYNLLYGNYDYCVIQQGAHPFPGYKESLEGGKRIIDLCKKGNVTPIVLMTWAEERFPENQQQMIDVYTELSQGEGALLAPVGLIWQDMVKEHPEVKIFFRDGEHAAPLGSYLIACTVYNTIFKTSPVGLPPIGIDFIGGAFTDWDNIKFVESKEEAVITLDSADCEIIQKTVAKFC